MASGFDDGLTDGLEGGLEDVEFLDLDGDEGEDGVDWLEDPDGEDEDRVGSGRDPRLLPPRAPRGRVLATAVSLGLVLSTVGGVATAAVHRHRNDVRTANALELAAAAQAPMIPGLAQLAFSAIWQAHPTERVLVPVLNQGPDRITLIDGRFTELGLSGPAVLKPVGNASVRAGGTGELAGLVTADCTTAQDAVPLELGMGQATPGSVQTSGGPVTLAGGSSGAVLGGPFDGVGGVPLGTQERLGALEVRARSASGRIGEQMIFPDVGANSTADRICEQQGQNVVTTSGLSSSVDPRTHTITVILAANSVADVPLFYTADSEYSAVPEASGLVLAQTLKPIQPTSGTVQPGGKLKLAFQIPISRCSRTFTPDTDNVLLNVMFLLDDELVAMEIYTTPVQPLIKQACGI